MIVVTMTVETMTVETVETVEIMAAADSARRLIFDSARHVIGNEMHVYGQPTQSSVTDILCVSLSVSTLGIINLIEEYGYDIKKNRNGRYRQ